MRGGLRGSGPSKQRTCRFVGYEQDSFSHLGRLAVLVRVAARKFHAAAEPGGIETNGLHNWLNRALECAQVMLQGCAIVCQAAILHSRASDRVVIIESSANKAASEQA